METDFSEIMERAAGNDYDIITGDTISGILKKREKDSHKGTYGHALLIAGSTGMTGAAVLAAGGALKSGCGLVTVHVPFQERHVIHISHPSAIVDCDPGTVFTKVPDNLHKYNAIGIGCGLGQSQDSISALKATFEAISGSATILDADALNIISSHPEMFPMIPRISVLKTYIRSRSIRYHRRGRTGRSDMETGRLPVEITCRNDIAHNGPGLRPRLYNHSERVPYHDMPASRKTLFQHYRQSGHGQRRQRRHTCRTADRIMRQGLHSTGGINTGSMVSREGRRRHCRHHGNGVDVRFGYPGSHQYQITRGAKGHFLWKSSIKNC